MARAPQMNSIGKRRRDLAAAGPGPLLLRAALAAFVLAGGAHAQTPDQAPGNLPAGAPPSQNFANGNPSAAQKAMQDAIPLTPEMIEELGRRFNATQRAREEAVTPLAAPLNRQINVSFAPGAATSIINTVKGYPTAVSFFDSTGQPWPIQWDTNSNPAAVAGGTNCNAPSSTAGGPSVAAIGFYVCTPTKGSNVIEITPVSLSPRGGLVVSLEAPDTGAPFLTGMLEGVPPADAVPLSVEGISPDDLRAWRLGKNVYLRTRYTLLSPEWTASEAEGGLTIYAVPNTPVVLLSVNGRTVSALLKDPS